MRGPLKRLSWLLTLITTFVTTFFTLTSVANDKNYQQQDTTAFDITVFNSCKALENGKDKSVLDKLLRSGIKPEIHYFDIFCPHGGLLLSSSLEFRNFQVAQYLLRYLRWRERETNNNEIRKIILNAADKNGETLVDKTRKRLSDNPDIAQTLELNSFLTLFKQHGGECQKYCKNKN